MNADKTQMPEFSAERAVEIALERLTASDLVHAMLKRRGVDKITIRPVEIKNRRMVQISTFDGRKTDVQNYLPVDLKSALQGVLSAPFRSLFVSTSTEETQIQFSKKGRPMIATKKRNAEVVPNLKHDRTIQRPLPEGTPDSFLQKIGMMTADGRIKADRQ